MMSADHPHTEAPPESPESPAPAYPFFGELARIVNAGQSRSILVTGNVLDLFHAPQRPERGSVPEPTPGGAGGTGGAGGDDPLTGTYLPLVPSLCRRYQVGGLILVVYELNGPIRFPDEAARKAVRRAWLTWRSGIDLDKLILQGLTDTKAAARRQSLEQAFDRRLREAIGRPTVALEFLRQLTFCSRAQVTSPKFRLMIIVEGADMLLPAGDGDITRLSAGDRHRIGVMQDWFGDPAFMDGNDSVLLLAESAAAVHRRVWALPQVLTVPIPAPDQASRLHYIQWSIATARAAGKPTPKLASSASDLAQLTAGLSIHALRQLLVRSAHTGVGITSGQVIDRVEAFITAQLGEDVIEFKKPTHNLDDVVGYTRLKQFIEAEMLPRMRATGADALPGAAVAGPIGTGKTYIFEAVAGALGLPVLVLKNIRSQYFGQTDVVFERLRRLFEALGKVVLFVDEADTQFGGLGPDAHATERRLTGKVQQMMSDPKLRGKVVWLLMTARIHRLSPDIRRPGRVGDLIIPVLDPEGDDRRQFIRWVLEPVMAEVTDATVDRVDQATSGYSTAGFAALRSQLQAKMKLDGAQLDAEAVAAVVHDQLPPALGRTRRYQALQALLNCTRRSLLPDPNVDEATRLAWGQEARQLEELGIT